MSATGGADKPRAGKRGRWDMQRTPDVHAPAAKKSAWDEVSIAKRKYCISSNDFVGDFFVHCVAFGGCNTVISPQVPTTPSKSQWEETPGRQKGSETPGATPSTRIWDATPAAVTPGKLYYSIISILLSIMLVVMYLHCPSLPHITSHYLHYLH